MKRFCGLIILMLTSCSSWFLDDEIDNTPQNNFEVFWEDFDRYYAYHEYRMLDWDSVYSSTKNALALGKDSLLPIVDNIIQYIGDGHVDLFVGLRNFSFRRKLRLINGNYITRSKLSLTSFSPSISYTSINDNSIAYIQIRSFMGKPEDFDGFEQLLTSFSSAKGIIIDIRGNGGGNDSFAKEIASNFTSSPRDYARIRYKLANDREAFSEWQIASFPGKKDAYNKPVILLTDQRCFSSTESFILMMKSIPGVVTVGDTTGGGSGNPILRELPNGWTFRLSNWQATDIEGNYFEKIGLYPDYPVWISKEDSAKGFDTILQTAVDLLN